MAGWYFRVPPPWPTGGGEGASPPGLSSGAMPPPPSRPGSATRSRGAPPSPSPSSLIIGEGTRTMEEMIKGLREGLLVEQLMGAEQGKVLGGGFSGNVLLGYKIEGGEVVGRVKDTMVSGNIYQCLKEGVVVGKGGRWVDGLLYTPPLYLSTLSVASKG